MKYWRPLLAELNTHRVFSRNSRSSRANPVANVITQVRNDPWGPKEFGINQAGMVALSAYTGPQRDALIKVWTQLADANSTAANQLNSLNIHKQVVNRLIEPFTYAMTVVTADDWDNFFKLRLASDAQPEMQDLAKAMKVAMDSSEPEKLEWNDWHLPYISKEDKENHDIKTLVNASAARCARVSYKAFDGSSSIEKDVELAKKLISKGHLSPLEMPAKAVEHNYKSNFSNTWMQYRKFIENSINL